ncbi:MAG TPA: pilus assembly protein CpaE [Micropepsaceae bacterium]|nr:pilus assembly protein CpaE [Micropepsaceae bacterium]
MANEPNQDKDPVSEGFGAAPHERPVPRISIEAFCEFADTEESLTHAATDRRLAKAHLGVHAGGVQEAVRFFSQNQTPNLLIVETQGEGAAVLQELEQLANVCDESTKVIVVGRSNDVHLYRELVRRGVSEYLVGPLTPLQFIETISGLYVNPNAPPIGRVVVVTGARGGTGASTIAHNVAWYIADGLKINTAIVDLDLPFGTAGLNFNEDPGQGVADALQAPERLDDVLLDRLLIKCGEHLSLFAAPALLDRDYEVDVTAYETVISQVRNSLPCVVVDMPHSWSSWSRETMFAADEIVIVATPDLASLRNTKNMLDVLKSRRVNDALPKLVLNQVGVPKRPEIPVKEFASAIGQEPTLVLPFEPQLFGTASNNGQMLGEISPNGRPFEGIRQLAEMLTGRVANNAAKKGGLSFLPFLNRKVG